MAELRRFPTSAAEETGGSCPQCDDGWTCEAHPGFKWPHLDETEKDGNCPGPGMPCRNGCLGITDIVQGAN